MKSTVEIVQGMRGRGKTNYVKNKLYLEKITPAYIIDIRNEFNHIPAFTSLNNFLMWVLGKRDLRDRKYIKFPIDSNYYTEGQFRFVFNTQSEWVGLFKTLTKFRNSLIVVDEADALFTVNDFKKPLQDVFLGSRNNNVSMIFVGKRPSLIPIIVRSQADKFVIFCVEEEWDIQYLTKRIKQTFPKDVYKLEKGEAIVWESGEKPYVEQFDKFKGE